MFIKLWVWAKGVERHPHHKHTFYCFQTLVKIFPLHNRLFLSWPGPTPSPSPSIAWANAGFFCLLRFFPPLFSSLLSISVSLASILVLPWRLNLRSLLFLPPALKGNNILVSFGGGVAEGRKLWGRSPELQEARGVKADSHNSPVPHPCHRQLAPCPCPRPLTSQTPCLFKQRWVPPPAHCPLAT